MQQLIEIIKNCTEEQSGTTFMDTYSGRGMYGKRCCGIIGRLSDVMEIIAEVISQLNYQEQDRFNFTDNVHTLLSFKQDNMGLDQIFYWPDLLPKTIK